MAARLPFRRLKATPENKTIFITGASRGVGRSIVLGVARDGANIVIVAKTVEPHPTPPGTIDTVAEEVERVGGRYRRRWTSAMTRRSLARWRGRSRHSGALTSWSTT